MGALSPSPPLQLLLSPKLTTSSSSSSLRVSTAAKSLIHHHIPISSSASSRTHSHRFHHQSSIDYASLPRSFLVNNPVISTNSKPNPIKQRATKKRRDEGGGGGGGEEVGEAARASSDQTEKPLPPRELDSNQSPSSSSQAAASYKEETVEAVGRSGESWQGVLEEIRQIEWPEFGKVLGTTGVVLSVIAGSSLVLLTVNAVFAELSDRAFAGRGVQDFFG